MFHTLCQLQEEAFVKGTDFGDLVEDVLDEGRLHQSGGLGAFEGFIVHLKERERDKKTHISH